MLPVSFADGALVVAISDPRDLQTFDDLRMLLTVPLVPVVAAPGPLRKAIESGYYSRLIHEDEFAAGPVTEITLTTDIPDADVSDEARIGRDLEPVIGFVNRLLTRGRRSGRRTSTSSPPRRACGSGSASTGCSVT